MGIFDAFGKIFTSAIDRQKKAAASNVYRHTVGKVEGKAVQSMAKAERKVFNAQNNAAAKLSGKGSPKKGGAGGGGGGGGAPKAPSGGGFPQGGAAPGRMMAAPQAGGIPGRGGGIPGRGGQNMGLFGSNQPQAQPQPQSAYCPQGHPVDPTWDVCPECIRLQQQGGGGGLPGMPSAAAPDYGGGQEKTQAIDLRQFQQQERQVVGWIVAQNGNHRGMDFRLYNGKNVIGTAADCDIVITDQYLSARHCTIRYENGNFVVIDLDSKNGTFVNQKKASKEDMIDNDTLRLGKTEFKFKSLF